MFALPRVQSVSQTKSQFWQSRPGIHLRRLGGSLWQTRFDSLVIPSVSSPAAAATAGSENALRPDVERDAADADDDGSERQVFVVTGDCQGGRRAARARLRRLGYRQRLAGAPPAVVGVAAASSGTRLRHDVADETNRSPVVGDISATDQRARGVVVVRLPAARTSSPGCRLFGHRSGDRAPCLDRCLQWQRRVGDAAVADRRKWYCHRPVQHVPTANRAHIRSSQVRRRAGRRRRRRLQQLWRCVSSACRALRGRYRQRLPDVTAV